MRASPVLVLVDICMHVCFSEAGLSCVAETSQSDPYAEYLPSPQCFDGWNEVEIFSKLKQNKLTKSSGPEETEDSSFPYRTYCVRV